MTMRIDEDPFSITRNVPNAVTLDAIKDAEKDENMNGPYEEINTLIKTLKD